MDAQWMRIYIEKTILKNQTHGKVRPRKGMHFYIISKFHLLFSHVNQKTQHLLAEKKSRKYLSNICGTGPSLGGLTISLQDPSSASKWNLLKQTHLPAAVTFESLTLGWLASNAIGTWDTHNPGMILELEHHGETKKTVLWVSIDFSPAATHPFYCT